MDVIVTFEDEERAGGPGVSLLELRDLFEDYPTVPLVVAMCDQARKRGTTAPVNDIFDLIRALYDVPKDRDAATWFEEELSVRHLFVLRRGVIRWLKD